MNQDLDEMNAALPTTQMLKITWLVAYLKSLGMLDDSENEINQCEKAFFAHAGRKPHMKFPLMSNQMNIDYAETEEYPENLKFSIV